MTTLTWKPKGGAPLALTLPEVDGFSFLRFGAGAPDVFLWQRSGSRAMVLANGAVDPASPAAQLGTLEGVLMFNGDPIEPVVLHDGCGHVYRFGAQTALAGNYTPPVAWTNWWLRDWWEMEVTDAEKLQAALEAHTYAQDDSKFTNPDEPASSTQRCCQYAWAGTIASCIGVAVPAVRDAALSWTDFQFNRPTLYYTADGKVWSHPNAWVDETGWRKGYMGKWARHSLSPYHLSDNEHLAVHRPLTAAVRFGDPVALLWCRAHCAALLSRPSVSFVLPIQQARAAGYITEALALYYAFLPEGPTELAAGLARAWKSVKGTFGTTPWGLPYALLRPMSVSTSDQSHVHLTVKDCERYAKAKGWTVLQESATALALQGLESTADLTVGGTQVKDWTSAMTLKAIDEGISPDAYTTDPGGVVWFLQHAPIWGLAIAYRGLHTSWALASLVLPGFQLLQILRDIILQQGAKPGLDENGDWYDPKVFHDSCAPRSRRAQQASYVIPEGGHGGTQQFMVPALMEMGDPVATDLARQLYFGGKQMTLHEPTLDCVQIAGLKAMAAFGVRP